jgi:hypothetical protein
MMKGHSKHSNDQGFGMISNHLKKLEKIENYK